MTNKNNTFYRIQITDRDIQIGIASLLAVSILIVYHKVLCFDFLIYDTSVYVTENTRVHAGITIDNIKWAFTTNFFSNWHPLTWLSYMLDMELWGLHPAGFHATNLVLHICNSLLLFGLLQKMTSKTWESWLVAGLFALHPLHIESVAWIAERKDVLSTFFFLLSIGGYIKYVQRQTLLRYSVLLVTFCLGLMSKSMVVTLPAVLLLLDYWPLRRCCLDQHRDDNKEQTPLMINNDSLLSVILEKIPLFLLAAIGGWMTIIAQQSHMTTLEALSFPVRLATSFTAYPAYIEKTLWPINLAILYPHPGMPPLSKTLIAAFILLAISILAGRWRHTRPWFIVGWLWFLGTLVPVIGLIHVGFQFIADRYAYIPHIGFFIIVSWGMSELSKKVFKQRGAFAAVAIILVLAAGIQTWKELHYWQNDRTLWTRTLEVTYNNYLAENNLGTALLKDHLPDEAEQHFMRAITINGQYADGYTNLGLVQANRGNFNEAIQNYQIALTIDPYSFLSQYRLAMVYKANNMPKEAIFHLQNALAIKPKFVDANIELGDLLFKTNQKKEALIVYNSLKAITPNNKDIQKKITALEQIMSQDNGSKP
jgi:protein O-mannosyl-transferase